MSEDPGGKPTAHEAAAALAAQFLQNADAGRNADNSRLVEDILERMKAEQKKRGKKKQTEEGQA